MVEGNVELLRCLSSVDEINSYQFRGREVFLLLGTRGIVPKCSNQPRLSAVCPRVTETCMTPRVYGVVPTFTELHTPR